MRRSTRLSIDEVSAVFRLVNECRELWADALAWQEHLVRGACRLTGMATGQFNEQRLAADLSGTQILDETFAGDWRDERSRSYVARMYASPHRETFMLSLARAGEPDGTLRRRFREAKFKDRVLAKTGTLRDTKALAGWVRGASGRQFAFAILCEGDNGRAIALQDAIVDALVDG